MQVADIFCSICWRTLYSDAASINNAIFSPDLQPVLQKGSIILWNQLPVCSLLPEEPIRILKRLPNIRISQLVTCTIIQPPNRNAAYFTILMPSPSDWVPSWSAFDQRSPLFGTWCDSQPRHPHCFCGIGGRCTSAGFINPADDKP